MNNTPFDNQNSSTANGAAANGAAANGATPPVAKEVAQPNVLRRLASQFRAVKAAGRGESWEHDPIALRRDKEENPLQRDIICYVTPPGDGEAVADTPKSQYLEMIAASNPMEAKYLHDFYDHRVRPLLTRYQDTVREETEKVALLDADIERQNAALEAHRIDLEGERDEKTRRDREAVVEMDKPLNDAHREAAKRTAFAGQGYDPNAPSPDAVLCHQKRALEAVAGDAGIPWTPGDASRRLPKWFLWALTAGTGVIFGLSLAIFGGFLDADAVEDSLKVVAGGVFAGFIVSAGGGWAIKHFSRAAAERYYLAIFSGRGPLYWVPSLVCAIGVTTLVIGMDAAIEFGGLLKAASLDRATGAGAHTIPLGLAYLVGMVITFGYALTYAREGALDGRYFPCLNRLTALQEAEFAQRDQEIRARAEVKEALAAIAIVRDVQREKTTLEARVAAVAAPFECELARLESLKRQPQREPSLEARRRIQDAHDKWLGANTNYDIRVNAALNALEPMNSSNGRAARPRAGTAKARGGFFGWLRRLFRGGKSGNGFHQKLEG